MHTYTHLQKHLINSFNQLGHIIRYSLNDYSHCKVEQNLWFTDNLKLSSLSMSSPSVSFNFFVYIFYVLLKHLKIKLQTGLDNNI